MSESPPEQTEELKRPEVARAFTASVRQSGEKRSTSSYLVTTGLAIALAGAVALGVGVIVFHHKSPSKTVNAANSRRSSPAGVTTAPAAGRPTPQPPVNVGPGAQPPPAGAPDKSADGKGAKKKTGSHSSSAGSSGGSGVRAAEVAGQEIISNGSGRCIDIKGASSSPPNGAALQIWDCHQAAWQKWSFTGGAIRSVGKCMTLAGSSSDGTAVQASSCNGGSSQAFHLTSAGDIVHTGTSECLDVKDKGTGNGTTLQVWKCSGTSNQKWHTG